MSEQTNAEKVKEIIGDTAAKLFCGQSLTEVEAAIDDLQEQNSEMHGLIEAVCEMLDCGRFVLWSVVSELLQKPPTVLVGDGKPLPAGVWQTYWRDNGTRFSDPLESDGKFLPARNAVYLWIGPLPPERIDPPAPPVVTPSRPRQILVANGERQAWLTELADDEWAMNMDVTTSMDKWGMMGWRAVEKGGGE